MDLDDVIKRLRGLADQHDDRADGHYTKARRARMNYTKAIERACGSDERRHATFLRDLADALEMNMPTTQMPVFDQVRW